MEGYEYPVEDKYYYEGGSEFRCACGKRYGRWCREELTGNEVEPIYCEGNWRHPIVFSL